MVILLLRPGSYKILNTIMLQTGLNYRIYRELGLNLRIKPGRRIERDKPEALSIPMAINQIWLMNFMSDTLTDGRSIRTFNVVDDYNRKGLNTDVGLSIPA